MLGFSSLANSPLDTTSDVTLQLTQVSTSLVVSVLTYSSIIVPTANTVGLYPVYPNTNSGIVITNNTSNISATSLGYITTPIVLVETSTISPGSVLSSNQVIISGISLNSNTGTLNLSRLITSVTSGFSTGSTSLNLSVRLIENSTTCIPGTILINLEVNSNAVNNIGSIALTGVDTSTIPLSSQIVTTTGPVQYGTLCSSVSSILNPGVLSVISSSTCDISGVFTAVGISNIGFIEGDAVSLAGITIQGQVLSTTLNNIVVTHPVLTTSFLGYVNPPVSIHGMISLSSPGNIGTQQFGIKNTSGVSSTCNTSNTYMYYSNSYPLSVITSSYSTGVLSVITTTFISGVSSSFNINTCYTSRNTAITQVISNSSIYDINNTKIGNISGVFASSNVYNVRGAYLISCSGVNEVSSTGDTQSNLFVYMPTINLYVIIESPEYNSIVITQGNTASSVLFYSNLTAVSSSSKISSLNTWGIRTTMINKIGTTYNENILKKIG
jgi:hypothetical protein